MEVWLKRAVYSIGLSIFQFLLVWYFLFTFWAVIILFLMLGGLMYVLEHRNFAWIIFTATLLFGLGMSLFGWLVMPGWVKPEDYFAK